MKEQEVLKEIYLMLVTTENTVSLEFSTWNSSPVRTKFLFGTQVNTTEKKAKDPFIGLKPRGQTLSTFISVPAEINVPSEETLFCLCSTVQLTKAPTKPDFEIKTVPKHADN